MNSKQLETLQNSIITQVANEYEKGFNHIRPLREEKRQAINKLIQKGEEGIVFSNLFWKNLQLELALFLTDELNIKFLSSEGILGEEIMKNAGLVAQFDDLDMNLREQRESIVNQNGIYGLSVTVIDARDDFENQPMSDVIDPLSVIIDPQNYTGSKMRFFGIERRVSKNWLETTTGFDRIKDLSFATSSELERNKLALDNASNQQHIVSDDGMVDIYDHFTVYNGYKWLTTWANSRSILIRAIQLEPLTEAEQKKPNKVKFPVQLHRRKPRYGCVFGVSIFDEVADKQDNITYLKTLQYLNAKLLALGNDTFADSRLGISTEELSAGVPGGRIIDITNNTGLPTSQLLYTQQLPAPSNFIENQIASLENDAVQTTNINQQAFGQSQTGTQTKAEIQTLQQNINNILLWISGNYIQGQKEYWSAHYRSYCLNMNKGKKNISLFQKGTAISLSLSKEDFIADGKVNVFITSKTQDELSNDKEFNKLIALSEIYLGNMKPGYAMNDFLRALGRKSNIRDFDEYRYIVKTTDEEKATERLNLINRNIKVEGPQDGEDYMTFILIYRQGLDTEAKRDVLRKYEQAYTLLQKPEEAMQESGKPNTTTGQMAMNNINQNANVLSTSIAK